jgi:hypothetical protein
MVNPAGLLLVAAGVVAIVLARPMVRWHRPFRWCPGDPEYLDKIEARGNRVCGVIFIMAGLLMFFGVIWQDAHWARAIPRGVPTRSR